ncbi:DNA polymerase delta subunit 4 [Macrotis lagotis]|uniref:DNA polymerase delta subunit 4 n=1 Tax=Macrotis lagotis TaxID=92651 RepID=UPI003D69D40F
MGRKGRLVSDAFPKVKRRKGGPGPGKAEAGPGPGPGPRGGGAPGEGPGGQGQPLWTGAQPAEEPVAGRGTQGHLELLRQFDLDRHFGPCTGITRLERWERAEQLGLGPPQEVLRVLWAHPGDPQYQCSLWHQYPI